MNNLPRCPVCNQQEDVGKVSALYVAGLERQASPAQRRLSQRLAPPQGRKDALTRPLHPDLQVLGFSLAAFVFLVGIWRSDPEQVLPLLLFLGGCYALYAWARRRLVAKFERQAQNKRDEFARVQQGVRRWMQLYYCAEDEVVFGPGAQAVALDELRSYLERPG